MTDDRLETSTWILKLDSGPQLKLRTVSTLNRTQVCYFKTLVGYDFA